MTSFLQKATRYAYAEHMASDFLKAYFGDQKIVYPINPFKMLVDMGLSFSMRPFHKLEGVYMPATGDDDIAVVGINLNRPIARQRFTAAHELCHHLRDSNRQITCAFNSKSNIERFAEDFAAAVLMPLDELRKQGMDLPDKAVYEGLKDARWPARFEVISHDPLTVYDGAHNPEGISAAVRSIRRYFGDTKVYILTGVMRDKDYADIARDLVSVVSRAFTVTPSNPRALSAEAYAETLSQAGIDATAYESLSAGLRAAMDAARADGVPLICLGSLYMYSEVIDSLKKY